MTDVKDVSGLRKLFDTIDIRVRGLKNLGYELDIYGPLLILIITFKIPEYLNLIISRKFDIAVSWLNALKTETTAPEKTFLVLKQGGMCEINTFERLLQALLITNFVFIL